MTAQYRSRRQAEALAGYRSFRQQLHEELGIEPSTFLRGLESAILGQDDALLGVAPGGQQQASARTVTAPATEDSGGEIRLRTLRERKRATILWCSAEASGLATTEDIEAQCARAERHQELMTQVIRQHDGTPELTSGGIVMAVFGAPVAHEDDPDRAVHAAVRIRELIDEQSRDGPAVRVRAGVATGEVLATFSSGASRVRVVGDVIALASHIHNSAPFGSVVVAGSTYRCIVESYECEELPSLRHSGQQHRIRRWRVKDERSARRLRAQRSKGTSIGRDSERELLASTLVRCTHSKTTHLITIVGEPGVGKSKLLSDFHDSLRLSSSQSCLA